MVDALFFLHLFLVLTIILLGTVISMHSTPDLDLTAPITRRLRQRDTVLRTSADPSLLVQALLDLSEAYFKVGWYTILTSNPILQ